MILDHSTDTISPDDQASVTIGGPLTVTGVASLTSNTASTNTTTGSLVVTGGVGVSGNLNVGGTLGAGTITNTQFVQGGTTLYATRISTTSYTPNHQLNGSSGATSTYMTQRWANDSSPSYLYLAKSRGGIGTYTVVQNNDGIGMVAFGGADGTQITQAASITAFVDGTPGTNNMPTRLVFATSASTGATPVDRMLIDSSGRVMVGGGSNVYGGILEVDTTSGTSAFSTITRHTADTGAPTYALVKSRGTTLGSFGLVSSGDGLGDISFQGTDGAINQPAALIRSFAEGTPAAGVMPARLTFSTRSATDGSPIERMRISNTGTVAIGTTSIPSNTHVIVDRLAGNSTVPALTAGTVMTLAGSSATSSPAYLQLISGNAAVAGLRLGDADAAYRGFVEYDHSTETLSLGASGSPVLTITTTGVTSTGVLTTTTDANIGGGIGVRNGVPTAASLIVGAFDRTVNGSTTGISNTVNLTNATLTADRNIYGQYNIVDGAYQNAAAFTAALYGLRADARTTAVGGNSVNGEGTLIGVYGYANHQTADVTYTRIENGMGVYGIAQATGATALIDQAYGVYSIVRPTNAGATINSGYLFYGSNSTVTGTMTNRYGVYIASDINNYFTGAVQVGGTATGPSTAGGVGVGVAPPGDNNLTAAGVIQANGRLVASTTGASISLTTGQGASLYITPGTVNDTGAAGTIANANHVSFIGGTFTATNARTYTDLATVYINTVPTASTNVTATNVHAFKVGAGRSFFPAGSATTPSIAIRDVNTGFYSSATDTLNIANNGALRFTFSSAGDFTAVGNVTAYSDRRIKKDIKPLRGALDKLLKLTGVSFTRIEDGKPGIGLIAQEVQEQYPELIVEAEDEQKTLSVAYGNLTGALIEALREINNRLEKLEKEIA